MSTPDLSRVIELIMQNPSLISEIQGLVKNEDAQASPKEAVISELPPESAPEPKPAPAVQSSVNTSTAEISPKVKRAQLLSAMKSYVSPERAKAIDSMLSISEILEVMKVR